MLNLKLDNRKVMKIYDSALCCATGICGVNVDPELLRISTVLDLLKKKNIPFDRYNLKENAQVYVDTKVINDCLMQEGSDVFPITTLDGKIVLKGSYPSNAQLSEWFDIPEAEFTSKQ